MDTSNSHSRDLILNKRGDGYSRDRFFLATNNMRSCEESGIGHVGEVDGH